MGMTKGGEGMSSTKQMEAEAGSELEISRPTNDEIAVLAYHLWEDRRCPNWDRGDPVC
jgi:hypothetical protein